MVCEGLIEEFFFVIVWAEINTSQVNRQSIYPTAFTFFDGVMSVTDADNVAVTTGSTHHHVIATKATERVRPDSTFQHVFKLVSGELIVT